MKYIIEGGQKLNGEIKISGNKNSILPCMVAALLTNQEVILENVPKISDVDIFMEIFKALGVKVKRSKQLLIIKAEKIHSTTLPEDLARKIRASILFVGPLLARMGQASFHYPGGDLIGRRNIKVHLDGMVSLGANLEKNDLDFRLKYTNSLKSSELFLEEASTTATENLVLFQTLGNGEVVIKNCPEEPQIVDLCQMLSSMGAIIEGVGTDQLIIKQVPKLSGTRFKVSDDYIEVITYAIAAAITKGKIKIICDASIDLDPILVILNQFGVELIKQKNGFKVMVNKLTAVEKVVTNIWPGFPTDLMSAVIVLATQARGVTLCHDWMYESRMFFVDKLISMGANITIADPHRVLVYGTSKLHGRRLESPDIRAGMALVLAALVAEGVSEIDRAELIERGYENVVEKLTSLGAKMVKI